MRGNLYAAVPAAGLAPFPLSPVIKINPVTHEVTPLFVPSMYPSPLFDFPTSLAFGTRGGTKKNLFVINPTPAGRGPGSGTSRCAATTCALTRSSITSGRSSLATVC